MLNNVKLTRQDLLESRTNFGRNFHGSSEIHLQTSVPAIMDTVLAQLLDTMLIMPKSKKHQNHSALGLKEKMMDMIHMELVNSVGDMVMPSINTNRSKMSFKLW